MLTLYDYLPSQNAWKVRLLLHHLDIEYRTELVSIFEGAGQTEAYLAMNPTGAVPAIRLEDGRVIAESNAILFFLATGTRYLPDDSYAQSVVLQWLNFEADYIQSSIATLRHWVMTGKDQRRPAAVVEARRQASSKALGVLERVLRDRLFLLGDPYTIADMAVFAYTHRAGEAGLDLAAFPAVVAWIDRVRAQPGFLGVTYPYAIDPHAGRELP